MDIQWGVSPAYHLSRYGDRFSPADVAASLGDIAALGFSGFQLEVFHPETLSDWAKGMEPVLRAAEKAGIFPNQFVGHFLLWGFNSAEAINSDFGLSELELCLDMLRFFPACSVVTVVIPAVDFSVSVVTKAAYEQIWNRFVEKMGLMAAMTGSMRKRLALEILPGSILGGIQGLLRLMKAVGGNSLGLNFDTGHAWAGGENITLIPAMLGDAIFGTHLKDNAKVENLSLAPGKGTIPWDALISNLQGNGYPGSWDLEIRCNPGEVQNEYEQGLRFLRSKISGDNSGKSSK